MHEWTDRNSWDFIVKVNPQEWKQYKEEVVIKNSHMKTYSEISENMHTGGIFWPNFYGIQGKAEQLSQSQFNGRKQRAEIKSPNSKDNIHSNWGTVNMEVLQVQYLVLLYINDLTPTMNSSPYLTLFTDDKVLLPTPKSNTWCPHHGGGISLCTANRAVVHQSQGVRYQAQSCMTLGWQWQHC
jgi:hypothetical protein